MRCTPVLEDLVRQSLGESHCLCGHGIGEPTMSGHSALCEQARAVVKCLDLATARAMGWTAATGRGPPARKAVCGGDERGCPAQGQQGNSAAKLVSWEAPVRRGSGWA